MPSQCSAPSWPLERRLHSLSRWTGNYSFSHSLFFPPFLKFSFPLKSLFYQFPHLLQVSISLSLSSVSISILTILLLGSSQREREGERGRLGGRQIGNIQSLEGLGSESLPAKPKASFPSSPRPPCCACTYTPRLPAMMCPQKWSSPKLTAHDF